MVEKLKDMLKGMFFLEKGKKEGKYQTLLYHRLRGMGVFNDKQADSDAGWDSERAYLLTDRVSAQRNMEKGTITANGVMPSANIGPTELLRYKVIPEGVVPDDIQELLLYEEEKRESNPPIPPEDRTIIDFAS